MRVEVGRHLAPPGGRQPTVDEGVQFVLAYGEPRVFPFHCGLLQSGTAAPGRKEAGRGANLRVANRWAGRSVPHGRGPLAGPVRAGSCWPFLPRDADDELRTEAAGAAARRGAVAEADAAPDADTAGAVTAPRRATRSSKNAISRRQALRVPPAPGSA